MKPAQKREDLSTAEMCRVLELARDEAKRFKHNHIATQHLLLGLLRQEEGVAGKVLVGMGVELNKVRLAVEFMFGYGDRLVAGEAGLTPRAKKVVELAVEEAQRLNHTYVGSGHLLLGLLREGEGIAAGILENFGVKLDDLRRLTERLVQPTSS